MDTSTAIALPSTGVLVRVVKGPWLKQALMPIFSCGLQYVSSSRNKLNFSFHTLNLFIKIKTLPLSTHRQGWQKAPFFQLQAILCRRLWDQSHDFQCLHVQVSICFVRTAVGTITSLLDNKESIVHCISSEGMLMAKQQLNSVYHTLEIFVKTLTSAVTVGWHPWLHSTALLPNTRYIPFLGEGLFSTLADSVLQEIDEIDKSIKVSRNLGVSSSSGSSRSRSWSWSWPKCHFNKQPRFLPKLNCLPLNNTPSDLKESCHLNRV